MQTNSESCVYVGGDDEVYGVQDLNDTSLFDEYSYYGAPQSPTFSGGYYFDNQEQSYDYGAYPYENYPVYYLYPTYPGYYALTNPEFSPENVYDAYYVHVPVYIYYYMPHFVYYLPTSTNNVNDIIYDVDSTQSDESDMMTYSNEQSFDNSQEFNSNFYNIGNISSTDNLHSCNEIVGEGITTCQLFYDEYPQTLNDAPVDDETKRSCINTCDSYSKIVGEEITTGRLFYEVYPAMLNNAGVDDEDKSVASNENLENNVVSNEAEENENITVNEESCSIEMNRYEDDVDRSLIKKISSMSIDDVKEDIDVNYENAKAFVYNEVLKGYIEIKNQLEELDWECHSLEDILEEEEPESDSSEMDVNENVAEDLESINMLPDEEDGSRFESVTLSEESQIASNEEDLVEDYQIMMEVAQPSADPLVVEEKDKIDPLELCLSEDNLHSGYMNSIEDHHLPADASAVDEIRKMGPFLEQSLSKEELHSGPEDYQIMMEAAQPSADPVAEEKDKTDPFLEPCLSKENLHSEYRNSNEEHPPQAESSAIEEISKMGPFLEESLSKKELHLGPINAIEKHHPSADSSVVEGNQIMDPIPQLSLREDELDAQSRKSIEEVHTKMSSEDGGEEILNSDPDVLAPAASKEIQRKKRFSGLRKFLARMCCCAKKRS